MKNTVLAAVTAAVTTSLSLASAHAAPGGSLPGFSKCFGIAAAGQNSCASATGSHDCAGQSTVSYSGEEWRATKVDVCKKLDGKLQPFNGVGHPTKS